MLRPLTRCYMKAGHQLVPRQLITSPLASSPRYLMQIIHRTGGASRRCCHPTSPSTRGHRGGATGPQRPNVSLHARARQAEDASSRRRFNQANGWGDSDSSSSRGPPRSNFKGSAGSQPRRRPDVATPRTRGSGSRGSNDDWDAEEASSSSRNNPGPSAHEQERRSRWQDDGNERESAPGFRSQRRTYDDYEDDEEGDDWGPSGGGRGAEQGGRGRRGGYGSRDGRFDSEGRQGGGRGWVRKEKRPTIRDDVEGEVLWGVAPVLTALQAGRRKVHALYMQQPLEPGKRKDARALQDVVRLVEAAGAPVREADKHDLNLLTDDRPHQGLVLDCSPLQWQPLDEFPHAREAHPAGTPAPVWLALDEVTDPQNMGAVLRSAYCLGASGILATAKNCAPLSAVVSKASAGALELLQLHSTRNMPRTLAQAVEDGWQVLGASAEPGSEALTDVVVEQPTILVMGNEGYGLRTNVKRACTGMVQIEMGADPAAVAGAQPQRMSVDSLNVSVATGILLHHLITSARFAAGGGRTAVAADAAAAE